MRVFKQIEFDVSKEQNAHSLKVVHCLDEVYAAFVSSTNWLKFIIQQLIITLGVIMIAHAEYKMTLCFIHRITGGPRQSQQVYVTNVY